MSDNKIDVFLDDLGYTTNNIALRCSEFLPTGFCGLNLVDKPSCESFLEHASEFFKHAKII